MQGKRTGIVDLTRGDWGTRGSAELRAKEAAAAAQVLGLERRENLGLKDGMPEDEENAITGLDWCAFAGTAREPYWPMHFTTATPITAGRRSWCTALAFLAGLARISTADRCGSAQKPHRPLHVLHYIQDRFREPSIVVDIAGAEVKKYAAIACYSSQFHVPGAAEGALKSPLHRTWLPPFPRRTLWRWFAAGTLPWAAISAWPLERASNPHAVGVDRSRGLI